jgi:CRISPR-associated DxTHG motif protein
MRKIITFLGRRPQLTQYEFNGQVYSGKVFAEAMRQFETYDQMLVCTTPEAHQDAWPVLLALNDERIVEVPIPRGESTAEMWVMFDAILDHIEKGDEVIFDITHGLRSLPFLVFLFAAYLKYARKVPIAAIYYGALELGDSKSGKPAPVINLSEFVTMLDWLTATDQFVRTGNARWLAGLINPQDVQHGSVAKASQALSTVSQAALLCQPFTLMESVKTLQHHLNQAENELEDLAHPFGVLSDQIIAVYGRFEANFKGDVRRGLKAEFELIEWYFDNNQFIQAMSLAREWLIDAATFRLGRPIEMKSELRSPIELAISGNALVGRTFLDNQSGARRRFTPEDLNEYGRVIYNDWPEREKVIQIWDLLSPLRNTLDHAEHQAGSMGLNKINQKAREVRPLLKELAILWSIIENPEAVRL